MASKQISVGIGIPMIIVGAILAVLLAPTQIEIKETIEFVGSLIGILGVVIFISGLFVKKTEEITT
jgi:flagellar biosynthesis protein FliQ